MAPNKLLRETAVEWVWSVTRTLLQWQEPLKYQCPNITYMGNHRIELGLFLLHLHHKDWLITSCHCFPNFLHKVYSQFYFGNYLWLEVCKHPINPPSLSYPCLPLFTFQNLRPVYPLQVLKAETYIIWCPLNFLISPVGCFTVYCLTWLVMEVPCSMFPTLSHRFPLPLSFHWPQMIMSQNTITYAYVSGFVSIRLIQQLVKKQNRKGR
jgi:hypothetical protein